MLFHNAPSSICVPVTIFKLEDRRKIIRVTENYLETLHTASCAFGIDPARVELHTKTLNSCPGQSVHIDASAYPCIWNYIDEVELVVKPKSTQSVVDVKPWQGSSPVLVDQAATVQPSNFRDGKKTLLPQTLAQEDSALHATTSNDRKFATGIKMEENSDSEEEFPLTRAAGGSKALTAIPRERKTQQPLNEAKPPGIPPKTLSKKKSFSAPAIAAETNIDSDERFDIAIRGPNDQEVRFKMRGAHSVKKVLAAVARTFDIPFERSSLYVVNTFQDENGTVRQEEIECNQRLTVAQCGINRNSVLIIHLNDHLRHSTDEDET